MPNNNNNNDTIIVKPQDIAKYPYFQAMSHFYSTPMGKSLVLKRGTSGFNNNEFNALKNIIEKGNTSKYELAMFFRNYLQIPKQYPNTYNPRVNIPQLNERANGYYMRVPGKKERQTMRKLINRLNINNNNNNNNNILNNEENDEFILVNASPNVYGMTKKAKSIYSKYPKSGKRPSKTSKATIKHNKNKVLRKTMRKLNKMAKKYESN